MKNVALTLLLYICVAISISGACPLVFPSSEGASAGIRIVRLSDGKVVADYDSDRLLVPASVQKCLTAATAQLSLPADFRFVTRLGACGQLTSDGTLVGPVVVSGGYDPTLGSRFFDDMEPFAGWAVRKLKEYGVKRVAPGLLMMPSDCPTDALSPYWLLEDLEWEYGAGCYPINYHDNSFVSKDGRMADADPASTLADVITARMNGDGIDIDAESDYAYSDSVAAVLLSGARVWCYYSPRRDDILKVMMHRSDNLYAEAMLRAPLFVNRDDAEASVAKADSAIIMQREIWSARGIDLLRGRVVDGSGLSPVNRMSAHMLSDILQSMSASHEYTSLFPVAGRDGTVKNFLKRTPLDGRMAMKSGSMTGVLCYAGYLLDRKGQPTHAVVVMVNGFTCTSAKVRSAIAAYLNETLTGMVR